jgi:cyclophilin family peptidyl-prolyl cis-trans isomerase
MINTTRRYCLATFLALFTVLSAQAQSANPQVKFVTTAGEFVVELAADKAPVTVENFLSYVRDGHYNGTIFHRVINNFMIQGGGYDTKYQEKSTKAPIKHEGAEVKAKGGPRNTLGTLAMARTNNPHSASAQFFINVKDNDFLNHSAPSASGWGYAVFGKVIAGIDVVDAICKVKTGRKGFHDDVPKEDVIIDKAVLLP